jgi:hypothetical protein
MFRCPNPALRVEYHKVSFAHKYQTRLQVIVKNKRASFQYCGVNNFCKTFFETCHVAEKKVFPTPEEESQNNAILDLLGTAPATGRGQA